MDWDDLNFEKKTYSAIGAYSQSKLANVLFTRELANKLEGNINRYLYRILFTFYNSCLIIHYYDGFKIKSDAKPLKFKSPPLCIDLSLLDYRSSIC